VVELVLVASPVEVGVASLRIGAELPLVVIGQAVAVGVGSGLRRWRLSLRRGRWFGVGDERVGVIPLDLVTVADVVVVGVLIQRSVW
jgi:hypothetical protein